MKKIAIGCGTIVALLALATVVGTYYVARKAKSFLGDTAAIVALDQNVVNTAAFAPPANGELTETMVKRFAAVQESMRARMGARILEAKNREDEFLRRQEAEHRDASASENFTVITDLMKLIVEAKRAWVDALNQERFSIDEYYWVRGRVYGAANLHFTELSLRDMPDAIKHGGDVVRQIGSADDRGSQHDKRLIAPYTAKLQEWAVLAFFGL